MRKKAVGFSPTAEKALVVCQGLLVKVTCSVGCRESEEVADGAIVDEGKPFRPILVQQVVLSQSNGGRSDDCLLQRFSDAAIEGFGVCQGRWG